MSLPFFVLTELHIKLFGKELRATLWQKVDVSLNVSSSNFTFYIEL